MCSKQETEEKKIDQKIVCENDLFVKDFERNSKIHNESFSIDQQQLFQNFQNFYQINEEKEILPQQKIDGNK